MKARIEYLDGVAGVLSILYDVESYSIESKHWYLCG